MSMIPTYPARPVQGGQLELAPPKRGIWFSEPKYNGWRALVHTPTGAMWNRHGESLTIQPAFRDAIERMRDLGLPEFLDCEALERRHAMSHGTLLVLDYVDAAITYEARRQRLEAALPVHDPAAPPDQLMLVPSVPSDPSVLYARLRDLNERFGCAFYEGIVMKRAGRTYPVQRISPSQCYPWWVKHRFLADHR